MELSRENKHLLVGGAVCAGCVGGIGVLLGPSALQLADVVLQVLVLLQLL